MLSNKNYSPGRQFLIASDHQPLRWLHILKEPNAKLQNWRAKLNEYHFKIDYIKVRKNSVADALSRIKKKKQDACNGILQ